MSKYDGTIYLLSDDKKPVTLAQLEAVGIPQSIVVRRPESTLFTVYRPARHRNESPVQYYKRTGCVDDRYFFKHNGRYYCNPAHCKQSWKSKKVRDEHLERAYALLR